MIGLLPWKKSFTNLPGTMSRLLFPNLKTRPSLEQDGYLEINWMNKER